MSNSFVRLFYISLTQLVLTSNSAAQIKSQVMKSEATLHYVIRNSDSPEQKSPLLILLHGHGSNENDLFSLSNHVPGNWIIVSVRGPYPLSENSYRWYDVQLVNGRIVINKVEEEKSRQKLAGLIRDISKSLQVDRQKVVVAGFSQGANMAQSLGLIEPALIAAFGVFSGRFVEEITTHISDSAALSKSKAFISHGSGDSMLPIAYAEENVANLKKLGIQLSYFEDTNGHSISLKQWNAFVKWLQWLN